MKFHDRLIELRKSKGWSQEELGERLNVTRQTVSKWELGLTTPEMEKLIELSRIFGITIDELVGARSAQQAEQSATNGGTYYAEQSGTFGGQTIIYTRRPVDYEYKSKRQLFGLPLVHINVGFGIRRAKGIIAIGNIAQGFIAFGAISVGLISFGALSVGLLLAFGGFALGGMAMGGIAVGAVAAGGVSAGLLAVDGAAFGKYALGGGAFATDIAKGGFAQGHIAIGDIAKGEYVWEHINDLTKADYTDIRSRILHEFPSIWGWILNLFA